MHQSVTTPHAPVPVLRAAVFAVVGTVLGMTAHHLLGEGPVPWAPGAAAAVVLFGLGLAGTRRPRRAVTVVVGSVAAQCALHLWLRLTAHPRPTTAARHVHQHGGHVHDVPPAWHERLHGSVAMTVAHALVSVLVAALLHRADEACWAPAHGVTATLEALRTRLAAVRLLAAVRSPAAAALGPEVVLPSGNGRLPAIGPVLAHAVVRRGPPPARTARVD